jgi:hypothetical protein
MRGKIMIKKENLKNVYASTYIEPTKTEIQYVLEHLEQINNRDSVDFIIKHYNCSLECGCERKEDGNIDVIGYNIFLTAEHTDVPEDDWDEPDYRKLSVLVCSECYSWALTD